jgi:hypothetical protein
MHSVVLFMAGLSLREMRDRKREEHRRVGNCNCDSANVIRAGGGNTNLTVPPRSSFYDKEKE